jgi:hypothetical protein
LYLFGCAWPATKKETDVGNLVGQSADSRYPQIDGCRSKPSGLQLIAVPENNGATERQSWLGAVPGDEVIDSEGMGAFEAI